MFYKIRHWETDRSGDTLKATQLRFEPRHLCNKTLAVDCCVLVFALGAAGVFSVWIAKGLRNHSEPGSISQREKFSIHRLISFQGKTVTTTQFYVWKMNSLTIVWFKIAGGFFFFFKQVVYNTCTLKCQSVFVVVLIFQACKFWKDFPT